MYILAPSILSADFSKLGEDVKTVSDAGGSAVHPSGCDGWSVCPEHFLRYAGDLIPQKDNRPCV